MCEIKVGQKTSEGEKMSKRRTVPHHNPRGGVVRCRRKGEDKGALGVKAREGNADLRFHTHHTLPDVQSHTSHVTCDTDTQFMLHA
jgi:hypothetical protein